MAADQHTDSRSMKCAPTGLPRAKRPLTDAHVRLLKVIAEEMLSQFFAEQDRDKDPKSDQSCEQYARHV
jgi:hypothetical protein